MSFDGTMLACTWVAALALTACGADETQPHEQPPAPCELPSRRLADGRCAAPGVADSGCAAGTWLRDDGSCELAGVPADGCADGFEATADGGCEPILPTMPCGPGLMALPGDTSCHEVSPCAAGTWGDIPVDATTVYVDASFGGVGNGTASAPFTTINEAVAGAASGSIIAIAAGLYSERVAVSNKSLRLWGTCPTEVIVEALPADPSVIAFGSNTNGSELHGMTIQGGRYGVHAGAGLELLFEGVYIHGASDTGLRVDNANGAASATLRRALIEDNGGYGIWMEGADLVLESFVVRGTRPFAGNQLNGRGLNLLAPPGVSPGPRVELRDAVIEANHEIGVFVGGAQVFIDAAVIRDTLPEAADNSSGRGLSMQDFADGATSYVEMTRTVVSGNLDTGMIIGGSTLVVDSTVVKSTLPAADGAAGGRAIAAQYNPATGIRSQLQLTHSLIVDNGEVGVYVSGSDAVLQAVAVKRTGQGAVGGDTRGITVQPSAGGEAGWAEISASRVEDSVRYGIMVSGSSARLDGVLVERTAPNAADGRDGRGLVVQVSPVTMVRGWAEVRGCSVSEGHEVGMVVADADVYLGDSVVRDTRERPDGLFGDGLIVYDVDVAGVLGLERSSVAGNVRGGVVSFGGFANVATSSFQCNGLQLVVDSYEGALGEVLDLGDNVCGCGDQTEPCKVTSTSLEPPEALAD